MRSRSRSKQVRRRSSHWSGGLGRRPLKAETTGSNPVWRTTSVPLHPPPGHRCAAAELSTGQTVMAGLWFLSERVAGPLALRGLGEWSAQTG